MTTLQIINNMIVINLPENPDDFDDCEKQKMIISIIHLGGFNINYTARSITLFLTMKGMYSYLVDFNRGEIDEGIAQSNFDLAVAQLGG
jgi:hypothetical protein